MDCEAVASLFWLCSALEQFSPIAFPRPPTTASTPTKSSSAATHATSALF